MLAAHFAILPVIAPLFMAPFSALFRCGKISWALATLVAVLGAYASLHLAGGVLRGEDIHYFMGDWQPPFGIEYQVDALSALLLLVINGMAAVMLPFAYASIQRELLPGQQALFYSLFLLCLAGLNGMVLTYDTFNLYVFLEISSLATYAMIGLGRDRRALTAAFQYLVLGTIGATFFLIGVGLLYLQTGTLNMGDLAARLPAVATTRPVLAAFAFLTVGLSMKFALFPLHMWLPNAYAYAPSFVSSFLAATATKVGIYALLRITLTVFGIDFSFGEMPLGTALLILSTLAILIGSYVAVHQYNVKKLLAFSSVAQIGYIAMGIGLGSVAGLTAGMIHIANHALAKGALFLTLGCMAYRLNEVGIASLRLDHLSGLAKRMPLTAMAFVLSGLALIGIPLSAGFISKWYLILAALDSGAWELLAVIIAGSLLAMIYIWRVVEVLYFRPLGDAQMRLKEAPLLLLIPAWLLVAASYYFGLDTRYTIGISKQAASSLFERHLDIQLSDPALESDEVLPENGESDTTSDTTDTTDPEEMLEEGADSLSPPPSIPSKNQPASAGEAQP